MTFTKVDFFRAISTGIMAKGMTQNDIQAFAEHEIELIEGRAARAKAAKANKATEPDAMTEAIAEALTDEFQTIADIVAGIGDEGITVSKATYRLNALVEAGRAEKTDLKIEGSKGTRKAFKRV